MHGFWSGLPRLKSRIWKQCAAQSSIMFVLALRQLRDRAVGPDLSEFVVEGFVGHHQLAELAHQRIARFLVERGEGAHGETFDQHLHADELLLDQRRGDEFVQESCRARGRP